MISKVERKERSHETILASAERLLRERGIAGARVADVMTGAGLTVGGFYAHFVSKESLIDETIRRAAISMRERLFARLHEKPPADRVEVILKRYLSAANRDEHQQGCPFPAIVGEIGTTAPEYGDALRVQIEEMVASVSAEMPPGRVMPKRTLALGLVALMYGGLSLARALAGHALSDEVLKACRAVGTFAARAESTTNQGRRS
ncbi:MAG: TetR/AcrR family transcriptional regulator [Polyangiaceae bacterium]